MLNFADLNVLLVDDEVAILELLRYLFTDRGSKVTTASDGRQALEELQHQDFDVVISDFRMPRLNGVTLLENLRANAGGDKPAVILVSGYQYLQHNQALDKGASALLSKPIEHEHLLELARRYATPRALRWQPRLDDDRPKEELKLELKDVARLEKEGRFKLGKGGFFVQIDNPYLEAGEMVILTLSFPGSAVPPIEGIGEIRWVRPEDTSLAFKGYGVEIISITDETRQRLLEFIDQHPTTCFIPLGSRAA